MIRDIRDRLRNRSRLDDSLIKRTELDSVAPGAVESERELGTVPKAMSRTNFNSKKKKKPIGAVDSRLDEGFTPTSRLDEGFTPTSRLDLERE